MLPPKLSLVYFDFGGRAEATRLALFIGGIPFEDRRVPYSNDGFSKSAEGAAYPYAMLPVLEVDGSPLAESMAMLRFVGRLAGLYPVNDATGAMLIDEILELVEVFTERCLRWEREGDKANQDVLERELTKAIIPQSFYAIDAKLQALKTHPTFSDDAVSSTATGLFIHDLVLRSFVRYIIRPDWDEYVRDRSKITHWLAAIDKVENHPKVKLYYALQAAANSAPPVLTTGDHAQPRADPIRLAFFLGKVAFDDAPAEGANVLSLRTEDGREIGSYFAILRYVGTLTGLYAGGLDALQSFRVDELLAQLEELQNWWYHPTFATNEKRQAFAKQLATETIPKFLTQLDRRVGEWAAPYATGTALTIADLAINGTLAQLNKATYLPGAPPVATAQYTHLTKIHDLVERRVKESSP